MIFIIFEMEKKVKLPVSQTALPCQLCSTPGWNKICLLKYDQDPFHTRPLGEIKFIFWNMIKTKTNRMSPLLRQFQATFTRPLFKREIQKLSGWFLPLSGHVKDISLRDSLGQLHRGPSNLVLLQKDICATKKGFLLFPLDIFHLVSIYFRMISPGHHWLVSCSSHFWDAL